MPITFDAKQALKETVKSLRARLLADLHDATESAWQMGVRVQNTELDQATRATRASFEAWATEQVRTQAPPATPTRSKRARGRRAAAADAEAPTTDDAAATATAAPARARRSGSAAERTADDFRRKAEKLAAATLRRRRGESLRERP